MITFDKLVLIITSLDGVHINHENPDWKREGGNLIESDHYRFGSQREGKGRFLPYKPLKSKHIGINFIAVDNIRKTVKIVVTGKIMPDPSMLLSRENFPHVWSALNDTQLLALDASVCCQHTCVVSADITIDIQTDGEVKNTIDLVGNCYAKNSYQRTYYGYNILFQSKAIGKRNKRSFTMYDKNKECTNSDDFMPNTLRLELRLTSLATLRQYLALEDCKGQLPLERVLTAQANPVLHVIEHILPSSWANGSEAQDTCKAHDSDKEAAFVHQLEWNDKKAFHTLKYYQFDIDSIRASLKKSSNTSRDLKRYEKNLVDWNVFKIGNSNYAKLRAKLIDKIKKN